MKYNKTRKREEVERNRLFVLHNVVLRALRRVSPVLRTRIGAKETFNGQTLTTLPALKLLCVYHIAIVLDMDIHVHRPPRHQEISIFF